MADINFKSVRGTGSFNEPTREAIFERDGRLCRFCGYSRDLRVDHILPRAKGGTDDPKNLQTLCDDCNRRKHSRSQGSMFAEQIGHFVGRPTNFQPEFVNLTGGDINSALVLSALIDTLPTSWAEDASLSLTDEDWNDSTGLTRRQRERAINRLTKIGLIRVRRQGMPARLFIAINIDSLTGELYGIIRRWVESRRPQLHPTVEQAAAQLHPQVEQPDTRAALQLHPEVQQAHEISLGSDPLTTPVHTREGVTSGSLSSSNGNKKATELSETVVVAHEAQAELIEHEIEPEWREVLDTLVSVPVLPGQSTVKGTDVALIEWAKTKGFGSTDAIESATYLKAAWRRLKYQDVRAAFQSNLYSKRRRAEKEKANGRSNGRYRAPGAIIPKGGTPEADAFYGPPR